MIKWQVVEYVDLLQFGSTHSKILWSENEEDIIKFAKRVFHGPVSDKENAEKVALFMNKSNAGNTYEVERVDVYQHLWD